MAPSIASVPGFTVGHAQDLDGCTGCTVVRCPPEGAAAAAVVRGMASSTRQFGIADPLHLVDRANAVLLAGGSAFGLDAGAGVMTCLREQGSGFATMHATVPVVPTAILYDLGLGDPQAKPTPEMAYAATRDASEAIAEGCVGAGTGASVGKLLTARCATKGGFGTWGLVADDGLAVGAAVAVNAFGDIYDPEAGALIAGARRAQDSTELLGMEQQILAGNMRTSWSGGTNTTLAVIATNADLSGLWLKRVASWASGAFTVHLRPAFTAVDGDVIVALATQAVEAEPHRVGLLARQVLSRALLRALGKATPLGGLPAASQVTPLPLEAGGFANLTASG